MLTSKCVEVSAAPTVEAQQTTIRTQVVCVRARRRLTVVGHTSQVEADADVGNDTLISVMDLVELAWRTDPSGSSDRCLHPGHTDDQQQQLPMTR